MTEIAGNHFVARRAMMLRMAESAMPNGWISNGHQPMTLPQSEFADLQQAAASKMKQEIASPVL